MQLVIAGITAAMLYSGGGADITHIAKQIAVPALRQGRAQMLADTLIDEAQIRLGEIGDRKAAQHGETGFGLQLIANPCQLLPKALQRKGILAEGAKLQRFAGDIRQILFVKAA